MQNSNGTQEPVVSQSQIDLVDRATCTTKTGCPTEERTSLTTKLSELEEVCHTALEEKTMQEVRERYKAILSQAKSNEDGIAEQQNPVSTYGGQPNSLDHGKESQNLGLALMDARTLFNDTSDLMKANVLEAFAGNFTTINELPPSTNCHNLLQPVVCAMSRINSLPTPRR